MEFGQSVRLVVSCSGFRHCKVAADAVVGSMQSFLNHTAFDN